MPATASFSWGARRRFARRGGDTVSPSANGSGPPTGARAWRWTSTTRGRCSCVRRTARCCASSQGRLPVLLLLEVGNTNTSVGVHDGARLIASWRLTSRREQTSDEYGLFIHTLLRSRGIEPRQISDVAISNVVPPVQRTLEQMAEGYFGVTPFSVQSGVNVPITLAVDNPPEVGADRVCNAVAAVSLYGPPCIVVDFGTATNFDCVNARGEFIGGAIAPGLATAAEALISRAARLYRARPVVAAPAVGRTPAHTH